MRGAMVDLKSKQVAAIVDAASGLALTYADGFAFVPDDKAMVGDTWDQLAGFTYKTPPAPSVAQYEAAMQAAGLTPTKAQAVTAAALQQPLGS